jgi:hypothetical protein
MRSIVVINDRDTRPRPAGARPGPTRARPDGLRHGGWATMPTRTRTSARARARDGRCRGLRGRAARRRAAEADARRATEVVTTVARWVKVDHDHLPDRVVRRPGAGEIQAPVDHRAIVEPCSP